MSKIFSLSLYITSFVPLWISVLFEDIKSCIENNDNLWTEYIGICCIVVFNLISGLIVFSVLRSATKEGLIQYKLKYSKEEKAITAEYLLSYILPLFAFDFTVWNDVVMFLIFFFTLGLLCVSHNHFSVNILLDIANYKIYSCTLENNFGDEIERQVISSGILNCNIGDTVYLSSLNNEYALSAKDN